MTKYLLSIVLLIIWSSDIYGQICDGNLGENIFLDGDFGSGAANIPFIDPQIAPGYIYQRVPPPDDGFYTITNNTTFWGSFAQNWDNIKDNSSDPNGYMMVVNASFEPGIFYEKEVNGLCENTLYVVSADVYNLVNEIRPNISFQLDGVTLYESGNVPYNRMWNTYGFTFSTQSNQTSVTLTIRNNAPGGQGNDLALDNITFRPCGPEALILPTEIENICEDGNPVDLEATVLGDQYTTPVFQWQQSFDEGLTWSDIPGATNQVYTHTQLSAGFYYYRYQLANDPLNLLNSKCRVISNVKIVNVVPKFYTIVDTICTGLSFALGENNYEDSGIYQDSLLSSLGCDSIVTLDLTVVPDSGIELLLDITDPSCFDGNDGSINVNEVNQAATPYVIAVNGVENSDNGSLVDLQSGDYTYLITDRFGCQLETTATLINPDPFTVDIGIDQTIDLGDDLVVNPIYSFPPASIQWGSSPVIECNGDCDLLTLAVTESQILTLTATSLNGCITMDTINIIVDPVRKVYFPNAFSPNKDGINEAFTIFGQPGNVERIEDLKIYDRWGNLLFQREDFLPNEVELGWDGTDGVRNVEAGVYTYAVRIRFADKQTVVYRGDLTLLR